MHIAEKEEISAEGSGEGVPQKGEKNETREGRGFREEKTIAGNERL